MNGKDIFLGLKYIGEDLIDEAEYGRFPASSQAEKQVRRTFRRPLLIAAAIALMALLVGCAVAYVLSMENVKISNLTETRNVYASNGYEVVGTETVNVSVLSLAGIKGSSAYQACADFYAYCESQPQINTQAEKEKMASLAESYGLSPQGQTLNFRTVRNLCDALGIDRFFREAEGIITDIDWGGANENGNISLLLNIYFPADASYELDNTLAMLRWNWKDCFSSDYIFIDDTGDWTEKHYTTTSGNDILILYSPSNEYGYLLCDREEALMSLQFTYRLDAWNEVDGNVWADYTYMTETQMELMAETVDFNIQPKRVTQADVEAQAAPPQEATQNGWTLKLKNVDTDGYVAHILLSVTAPEGTVLDDENIATIRTGNDWNISPMDGREFRFGDGGGFSSVDDGDGLGNTIDLFMDVAMEMTDDSAPFGIGTQWELHIVDLIGQMEGDPFNVTSTLVEGEWTFTVTFDESNGDYQEIQLLSEPVTAKGCIGWKADGTDVLKDCTLTSFVLRKYSSTIDYAEKETYTDPDFYCYRYENNYNTYAVMKDGTRIALLGSLAPHDEIDLSQVDHIIFPDGTILKVPET